MAGCDTATTCPDISEVIRRLQSVGFLSDLDTSVQNQISPLFHHLLSLFLSQIVHSPQPPPPHALDDGRPVDLFRLFCSVRERDGYDVVSSSKGWPSIAEDIGLGIAAGSVVKLLYAKHLVAFEQWLESVLVQKKEVERSEVKELVKRLEERDSASETGRLWTPTKTKKEVLVIDTVDPGPVKKKEVRVMNSLDGKGKRKTRAMLYGMVDWVSRVAKRPGDPSHVSKIRGQGDGKIKEMEWFSLALRARNAVFESSHSSNEISLLKKRRRSLVSLYEDIIGENYHQDRKQRCSERILKRSNGTLVSDPLATKSVRRCTYGTSPNSLLGKYVPVDPRPDTRAFVPPVTVKSCNFENSRLLGKRIWPPTTEKKSLTGQERIGKGRDEYCLCAFRGSVECIRLHVAERRLQLKREIGLAFYHWKFNKMGEEISLSWSEEEEEKFKAVVRSHRRSFSENVNFWEHLYQCFPSKSRETLVSYYFNVFLLRRRSYQNRVTPSYIDSDDEEPEFGFLSKRFGENAVKITEPRKHILCSRNEQCVDFDDIDYKTILDDVEFDF